MGVVSTTDIPSGKRFGPFPTSLTLTDPGYLIGHMAYDERPDLHTIKVNVAEVEQSARAPEWMPYIQTARDEKEQNLEALLKDGQIYYQTIKPVLVGDELLVWYGKDYAIMLGLPNIQPFYLKESGLYSCPYCSQSFQYPHPLRAHMRFKCEHRMKLPHSSKEKPFNSPSYEYMTNNFERISGGFYPGYPAMFLPGRTDSFEKAHLSPNKSSPPIIRQSSPKQPSPVAKPIWRPPLTSSPAEKRKHIDNPSSSISSKRITREEDVARRSSPIAEDSSPLRLHPRLSPSSPDSNGIPSPGKVDQNQNLHQSEDEEAVSAFRKVEKGQLSGKHSPPSSVPSRSSSYSTQASTIFTPRAINAKSDILHKPQIPAGPANVEGLFRNRYPLMPGGALPRPMLPSTGPYNENFPVNMADLYRNSIKPGEGTRTAMDKLADIRNLANNGLTQRLPFMPESRPRIPSFTPYIKPPNPMVDKMLHSPPPPSMLPSSVPGFGGLAQNWCAKCNATFRMTSDLVYHMRSHHKREFDPMKRKREEKLKCNVCNETFRERHHLTRHMTSHQ